MDGAHQNARLGEAAPDVVHNRPWHVLVVDDDLSSRKHLRKLLEARGHEVRDVADGQTALEMVFQSPPDLILIDVLMPQMDGFELCRKLHRDPRTSNIAIIMVSAKTEVEDVEAGFEYGAIDYIRKPFNPRELLLRVDHALSLKKSNDARAIWNKRVARDLELAGAIQRSLFPEVPLFTRRLEMRMAYRPCMDVGGDAFDVIALPDGKYCIYIADVAGHGVAPAMIASLLKATASEMIPRYADEGPAAICNEINAAIHRSIEDPAYFATLFMALHDPKRLEWRCMNCGHPNPLLVHENGRVESALFSAGGGAPIGFPFGGEQPYSPADEVRFKDEGGSFLLLYTDGISEARHADSDEQCGDRIREVYLKMAKDPAVADKASGLLDALKTDGYQLDADDCTAISIHMLDPLKVVIEQAVPRNIYLVSDIARQCETAVTLLGISADTAALLRLLVMELGANLVDHSGLGEEEVFWLQVRVDGKVCQVVLRDSGAEWDVETALNLQLEEAYMRERGRGLVITQSIVDRIEHFRINSENLTFCTIIDQKDAV